MNEPDELSPTQQDAVRRALADVRHTDPVPSDVAARLDHVLDGLNAERTSPAAPSLDARRRRRYAARTLVAAAAVVIGGFGVDAMLGGHHLTPATEQADSAGSVDREGAGAVNSPDVPGGPPYVTQPTPAQEPAQGPAIGDLDPTQAKRLATIGVTSASADALRVASEYQAASPPLACRVPATGHTYPVVYQGRAAALLVHEPVGTRQFLDIYSCPTGTTGHLIRRIVVTAR